MKTLKYIAENIFSKNSDAEDEIDRIQDEDILNNDISKKRISASDGIDIIYGKDDIILNGYFFNIKNIFGLGLNNNTIHFKDGDKHALLSIYNIDDAIDLDHINKLYCNSLTIDSNSGVLLKNVNIEPQNTVRIVKNGIDLSKKTYDNINIKLNSDITFEHTMMIDREQFHLSSDKKINIYIMGGSCLDLTSGQKWDDIYKMILDGEDVDLKDIFPSINRNNIFGIDVKNIKLNRLKVTTPFRSPKKLPGINMYYPMTITIGKNLRIDKNPGLYSKVNGWDVYVHF